MGHFEGKRKNLFQNSLRWNFKHISVGGAHLYSQHSGGRGRWVSEFEASLVYTGSSRTARTTQRNPVLIKQNNKINKSSMVAQQNLGTETGRSLWL